jgi:hypothetical protein
VSRARVSSGGLKSNASGLLSALLARSRVRLERCLLWTRWYWLRLLSKHPPQLSTPLYCVCLTCQRLSNVAPCLAASERVRRSFVQGRAAVASLPYSRGQPRRSIAIFDLSNAYLQKCPSRSMTYHLHRCMVLLFQRETKTRSRLLLAYRYLSLLPSTATRNLARLDRGRQTTTRGSTKLPVVCRIFSLETCHGQVARLASLLRTTSTESTEGQIQTHAIPMSADHNWSLSRLAIRLLEVSST